MTTIKRIPAYPRNGGTVCHYCGLPSPVSPCERADCVPPGEPLVGVYRRTQLEPLRILASGPRSINDLAEVLGVSHSTSVERVQALVVRGLVKWEAGRGPNIIGRASLTPAGWQVLELNDHED